MKNLKKFSISILLILLIIWVLMSFLRTMYNFSKLFTEETAWYGMTTEQQKSKQFGILDSLYIFVQKNTHNGSTIKLYTNNLKAYYLGRYYLYPTKIISQFETSLWENKKIKYDYILFYDYDKKEQNTIKNYLTNSNKIKYFKYDNKILGILYKL